MTREEAIAVSWEAGRLRHLLDATQRKMYDAVHQFYGRTEGKLYYINSARQLGKSFLLRVLSLEFACRIPGAQVKYVAPTLKMARAIFRPGLFSMLEQCPKHLRPNFDGQDDEFRFPNGSRLTFAGCDGDNFERLRGQHAHAIFVDEAGFVDKLQDVVQSVLMPQLLTTRGKIVFASTPSDSVDHYSTALARECEARGTYSKYTVHDNVRVPKDELAATKAEYGGEGATRWRREYLCEFVTDSSNMVLPSWTEERAKSLIEDLPRPKAFDAYVSIDLGYQDASGALFAYYDYEHAWLVIEDEWRERRQNSEQIMEAVIAREAELWRNQRPYRRIYDAGAGGERFAADFQAMHGFQMLPALKDNLHAAVNRVDVWLVHGRIKFNPRVKKLIQEMFGATWDSTRKRFKRAAEHHYDLLAALIYMVRHVDEFHNPFTPEHPDITNTWVNADAFGPDESSLEHAFRLEMG